MKRNYVILTFFFLFLSSSAFGQELLDKLIFKDGSEQIVDIVWTADHVVGYLISGNDAVQRIDKSLLAKIIYRDGREVIISSSENEPKEPRRPAGEMNSWKFLISAGTGFPLSSFKSYEVIPVWGKVEYCVKSFGNGGLGVGASFKYAKQSLGDASTNAVIGKYDIEAVVAYHHFVAPRIEVHGGVGVGYGQRNTIAQYGSSVERYSQGILSASGYAGASFFMIPFLGVTVEAGYFNGAEFRLGLVFKI